MFLFGGKKNQPKKIQGEFEEKIKTTIKNKLCPLCNKVQSNKIAFGEGVQPTLTCNNCELKAVGNIIQKLGNKNLLAGDKFATLLTSELMIYQKGQTETPAVQKENPTLAQNLDKKVKQLSATIKTEFYCLKQASKAKSQELAIEAHKQNSMPIFDDTLKLYSEHKTFGQDLMGEMIKRSLIGAKGVHFIDQQELKARNDVIDHRFETLKKETKIKLKNLSSLITDINNIKLE